MHRYEINVEWTVHFHLPIHHPWTMADIAVQLLELITATLGRNLARHAEVHLDLLVFASHLQITRTELCLPFNIPERAEMQHPCLNHSGE